MHVKKYIGLSAFLLFSLPVVPVRAATVSCDAASAKAEENLQMPDNVSAAVDSVAPVAADSLASATVDSLIAAGIDSVARVQADAATLVADTVVVTPIQTKQWMPDPKKAMWLAIAFPGGGQIYNRKYWKLPIFYGGFLGCFYAYNWNNTMYRDYAQAYIDIMDDDENTNSFTNFLPPNYDYKANATRLQNLFRKKKDFYRRYRDLSLFCFIGVYLLSIVDAYVDAELSSFDISRDLSMKVRPAVINDNRMAQHSRSLMSGSYGVSCSLSF